MQTPRYIASPAYPGIMNLRVKIAKAPPTLPNARVIPANAHPRAFMATFEPSYSESSAPKLSALRDWFSFVS